MPLAQPRDHDGYKLLVLFGSAAALRFILFFSYPQLPDLLTARVEISTPATSFKRLQEGLFLFEKGIDPYDGGVFHQAPLLLPVFALLPCQHSWIGKVGSFATYVAIDLLTASSLHRIASSNASSSSHHFTSPRKHRVWSSMSVAAIYLFNPFTILTCLGRPTSVFTTLFTILSIENAIQARIFTTTFALAVATYLGLHPAILLAPIVWLCYDRYVQAHSNARQLREQPLRLNALSFAAISVSSFLGMSLLLLLLSRLLLSSWQFIPSVYTTLWQLPDLTPNAGVWWYFFIEMFDAFRSFFLGVFWLHMMSYSIPLCLRFRRQPLAAVIVMMGIVATFEPYANIGDTGLWLSMLGLLGHVSEVWSLYRYNFPAMAALLYGAFLGPAFHHLWIYAGSGNANFFYAITLVWSLALLVLLTDAIYSVLRDEWEKDRPEGKGREIRQV